MVRFGLVDKAMGRWHQRQTPNYFSRREQQRLLVLVLMLGLVVLLMAQASQPDNWRWLWRGQPAASTDERRADLSTQAPAANEVFPGIDQADVRTLKDNTVFLPAETEIWYRWLELLGQASPHGLRTAPAARVGHLQLYQQTAEYRGKLVTISGTVRRAHYIAAPANPAQIKGYWQCWLFPGKATWPVVVYALEMPAGFPVGLEIEELVEFTGLVYKRWAYPSKEGPAVAPVVLAKTGQWTRRSPPAAQRMPGAWAIVSAVAIATLLAITVAWMVYVRAGAASNRGRAAGWPGRSQSSGSVGATRDVADSSDVRAWLAELGGAEPTPGAGDQDNADP